MKKTLPLLVLLLSLSAFAQTSNTYDASTGNITSTFVVSMNLDAGGSATVYVNLPGCYYPGPCGSQYNQVNYSLPDGTTASFYPVAMSFYNTGGSSYKVVSTAGDSGTDSKSRPVTLDNVTVNMHTVACHQPRGTCPPKKVFDSGAITVTR